MKNKSPLTLMEQLIMLMVFAIAAALCLQIFALSGRISRSMDTRDRAITAVQNAAESIKISSGNLADHVSLFGGTQNGNTWEICYNADWEITSSDNAVYFVTAVIEDDDNDYLGTADVCAVSSDGEVIFKLTAAWQEVSP